MTLILKFYLIEKQLKFKIIYRITDNINPYQTNTIQAMWSNK